MRQSDAWLEGWESGVEYTVRCPVCQHTYNHQYRPTYEVRRPGTMWGGSAYPYHGYDNADPGLCIPFTCEAGHKWDMVIGHHKGITTLQPFSRTPPDLSPTINIYDGRQ